MDWSDKNIDDVWARFSEAVAAKMTWEGDDMRDCLASAAVVTMNRAVELYLARLTRSGQVAKDEYKIRNCILWADVPDDERSALLSASSRLAAGAQAREQDVKILTAACNDAARQRDAERTRREQAERERDEARREERAAMEGWDEAQKERDAARQERDESRESMRRLRSETQELADIRDRLERERDTARQEAEGLRGELENVRPFEALHADLSEQLRAAWEATGVASTVKGMTTLADVVGVTKADLRAALAEAESLRAQLDGAQQNEALALEQGGRDQEKIDRLKAEVEALRARVAELEADNAKAFDLLSDAHGVLARVRPDHGPDGLVPVLNGVKTALAADHPGAALLEQHAKALIRARNEGLKKAARAAHARVLDELAYAGVKDELANVIALNVEGRIRAMKEPES